MQSPLLAAKFRGRAIAAIAAIAAIVLAVLLLSIQPAVTQAQVYQIQPDGSLLHVPRYANPNLQPRVYQPRSYQPPTYQPQIYPGQIINGERVIAPLISATQPGQSEAVSPPKPREGNSDQQSQRPDKIPVTVFPIPEGPSLKSEPVAESKPATSAPIKSAPAKSEAITIETPPSSESSNLREEKSELTQLGNLSESKPDLIGIEPEVFTSEELEPLNDSAGEEAVYSSPSQVSQQTEMPAAEALSIAPTELDPPSEPESSQMLLSEAPSSDKLSLDEFSAEDIVTDQPPIVTSPAVETPSKDTAAEDNVAEGALADDLTLDPPSVNEDMMAEIKEIRDQLGGGISETLNGVQGMPSFGPIEISPSGDSSAMATDQDVSPDALFNEQLRSVMSQQETNSGSIIGSPQAPLASLSAGTQIQTTYADRKEELRNCARELEQLAGRLESVEAYENADQLRRQASELWTSARQR